MEILCSELYETQLKEILKTISNDSISSAKNFKMYLDTLIVNIPTKAKKYKQSIYFDNENLKDLECENYTVVFSVDKNYTSFVLLGIVNKF